MAAAASRQTASDREIVVSRTIAGPRRLVFLHGERPDDPRAFVSTVTLVERGGATEVTMRAVFKSKAQRDEAVERFGAVEGGRQTLGRLEAYVSTLTSNE
jgi:uncharacterized protein YndB with AHSA1/START domain